LEVLAALSHAMASLRRDENSTTAAATAAVDHNRIAAENFQGYSRQPVALLGDINASTLACQRRRYDYLYQRYQALPYLGPSLVDVWGGGAGRSHSFELVSIAKGPRGYVAVRAAGAQAAGAQPEEETTCERSPGVNKLRVAGKIVGRMAVEARRQMSTAEEVEEEADWDHFEPE